MDTNYRRLGRIDTRVMRVVPPEPSHVWDSAIPALGRAADHGLLWFALAGGLGLARNRRLRRAALRGLAAQGVASATANLVGKSLVRRGRPTAELTPFIRRLRTPPTSSSFPSGHAASAAAFATGVALEHPRLALPVTALAVGVGVSRVVTGVHYPSDVVAGAAIGVAAGLVTTRWWPTAPPLPASAQDAGREAPALPTGRGLIAVVNTAARGADDTLADLLRRELPEAEVIAAADGEEAASALADAAKRAQVLGAAGGDGTVNTAARLAAERGIPLLVVPAGTLNHFARDLGVDDAEQALAALRAGEAVEVDAGTVNDDAFMNTFSVGAYVDLVRERERHEAQVGKWPAMVLGAARVLRGGGPIAVRVDGKPRRIWLLFAGNCRYEPAGLAPSYRTRLADGDLDVRIVDGEHPLARLRLVIALATGTLTTCPVYECRSVSSITLESADGAALGYCIDGEACPGAPKLTLRKLTGRLVVYRPAEVAP
ncbi:MAG TPA: phosphatase PAP2 family protein [Actinospica sp.]|nr:phosphatase PAP2 family protein [Actinospica sp.]